jgi:hypothetical protein
MTKCEYHLQNGAECTEEATYIVVLWEHRNPANLFVYNVCTDCLKDAINDNWLIPQAVVNRDILIRKLNESDFDANE